MKIFAPILALTMFVLTTNSAHADSNNFFGSNAGSASPSPSSTGSGAGVSAINGNADYSKDLPEDSFPNQGLPGLNDTAQGSSPAPGMGSDFTGDEKRMQRKYRANINNAKNLIDKGTRMMKDAGNNPNDPNYKKGKIRKEIGEKTLAGLNANNPFAGLKNK